MCCGFPYIDMQTKEAVAMAQTVRQRYKGYTKREVQDAIAARKTQAMLGHPTDAQFQKKGEKQSNKKLSRQTRTHHKRSLYIWPEHRRSARKNHPLKARTSRCRTGTHPRRLSPTPQICSTNCGRHVCKRHSLPGHALTKITARHHQTTANTHSTTT